MAPPDDYCENCTYRAEYKGLSFKASDIWYNFVVSRSNYHKKLSVSANGKIDCGRFVVIDLGRDFPHRLLVTSYPSKTSSLPKVESEQIVLARRDRDVILAALSSLVAH